MRLIVVLLSLLPTVVHASEFWEEVKAPGIRVWRAEILAIEDDLQAQRLPQAAQRAQHAVDHFPDRGEGWLMRGVVCGETALRQGASLSPCVSDLRHAYELDVRVWESPQATRAFELLSNARATSEDARVLLVTVARHAVARIQGDARRGHFYALLGDALLAGGEATRRDAMRAYREALRQAPQHRRAVLGLSLAMRAEEGEEWRVLLDRVGSMQAGEVDASFSPAELACRRALLLERSGAVLEARAMWASVEDLPWRTIALHALSELDSVSPPASQRRGRTQP